MVDDYDARSHEYKPPPLPRCTSVFFFVPLLSPDGGEVSFGNAGRRGGTDRGHGGVIHHGDCQRLSEGHEDRRLARHGQSYGK